MAAKHVTLATLGPLALALLLAGCGDQPGQASPESDQARPAADPVEAEASATQAPSAPADAFLERIAQHCGQSFEGRIIDNTPPRGEDPPAACCR